MLRALLFFAWLAVLLSPSRARAAGDPSLLAGLAPIATQGIRRAHALNDGLAAAEGDPWRTTLTTQLDGPEAFVLYDLGSERPLAAAWLQGDNNDAYLLEVSRDGRDFELAWEALPVPEVGLRSRYTAALATSARYVRLRAARGDHAYAVSELLLFSSAPAAFPPPVPRGSGVSLDDLVRDRILVFALALIAAVVVAHRGAPRALTWACAALPLAAAVPLALALWGAWPLPLRGVALVRGAMAAVAAVAVAREVWSARRFPLDRRFSLAVLGVAGSIAVLAFYNLGAPQFRDESRGTTAFAHYLDLRQYHPTAKFFPELGYRGIYEADVAAYAESTGQSLESLSQKPMRDLEDPRQDVTTVGAKNAAIVARRARFSASRWDEYKRDAAFFRAVMGDEQYLTTMVDFGAYATPVWLAVGHLLWMGPPSRAAFTATGLLDAVLFALAFGAIGYAYGARTTFVAMVVFGANDLVVFGTDWAGATLRHDWLAYMALAAAAFKLGKPSLAGALLAAAAMIRAFPALALAALALPLAWSFVDHRRAYGRYPSLARIRAENEPLEQAFFAAALTGAVLFVGSSLLLDAHAWTEWYAKVTEGQSIPHMADVSFRALVGGANPDRPAVLLRRWPLVLVGGGGIVTAVVLAARRASPSRAMLLGIPLVPTLLNPTSYYAHMVFLLVLLVETEPRARAPSRSDAVVWLALLTMCSCQYFAQLTPDNALRFYLDTALLMVAMGVVLVTVARERVVATWATEGQALRYGRTPLTWSALRPAR